MNVLLDRTNNSINAISRPLDKFSPETKKKLIQNLLVKLKNKETDIRKMGMDGKLHITEYLFRLLKPICEHNQ